MSAERHHFLSAQWPSSSCQHHNVRESHRWNSMSLASTSGRENFHWSRPWGDVQKSSSGRLQAWPAPRYGSPTGTRILQNTVIKIRPYLRPSFSERQGRRDSPSYGWLSIHTHTHKITQISASPNPSLSMKNEVGVHRYLFQISSWAFGSGTRKNGNDRKP